MITITHTTHDNTRTASNGNLEGQVRHVFYSTTHWSSVCEVYIDYNPYRSPEVGFTYGSGGCNPTASDVDIAMALSQAFCQAAVLLAQLTKAQEVAA